VTVGLNVCAVYKSTYLLTYFDVYAHEMAPLLTSALQLLTGSYGQLWQKFVFSEYFLVSNNFILFALHVTGGKSGVGLYDYYLLVDGVSGLERLDALEGLSVITDDQMSVGTNSTSELLVVSSSAAGSLSPSNVIRGQEPHDASVQSTSPLRSQMYAILHYILSLIM